MRRLPVTIDDLFPPPAALETSQGARTRGLHVTDIVYDLCSGLWPQSYPPKPWDPDAPPRRGGTNPRLEFGNVVEDLIGAALANRLNPLWASALVRPGEITVDDITGTPDFVFAETPAIFRFPDDGPAVVDTKATWLTTRHEPDSERFTYWRWQGLSYCAMMGIPRLILLPLHINGDYTFRPPGGGPQFQPLGEDFTARELDEHWRMMTGHAARMWARVARKG